MSAYVSMCRTAASAADAGPRISAGGGGGGLGQCDALASASLTTPALERPRSQTCSAFSASFWLDEPQRRMSAHPPEGDFHSCIESNPAEASFVLLSFELVSEANFD